MRDLKRLFSVGDKIQIEYIDRWNRFHSYVSQINNIYDDNSIDILIPISKNRIIHLAKGAVLKVIIVKGEAVYEFKSKVSDKMFGAIPLLKIQLISEIEKIQRRDYFRLKIIGDLKGRRVIDLKERAFGEEFSGNLLDISGGGIMFNSTVELNEKEMIQLNLDLNNKKMVLYGVIIRRTLNNNPKAPYTYGVKFENITEFERNEITKFVFEMQRKLIKKGLM